MKIKAIINQLNFIAAIKTNKWLLIIGRTTNLTILVV